MDKDLCKFDILIVTPDLRTLDTLGMMIYHHCPNFNLLFASNIRDAVNKTLQHAPQVFIVDCELYKVASYKNFETAVQKNPDNITFYLIGSDGHRLTPQCDTQNILSRTIPAEELRDKLEIVAQELFWKRAATSEALRPAELCQKKPE